MSENVSRETLDWMKLFMALPEAWIWGIACFGKQPFLPHDRRFMALPKPHFRFLPRKTGEVPRRGGGGTLHRSAVLLPHDSRGGGKGAA